MTYRLRILSGRHEGAELPLTARRYSLGSSEDNTLILSDDAIAEHHLSFFFADGELSVLQAPGGVRIDGKKVETFPVDVAPFQVMTLAGSGEKDNISLAYGGEAEDETDAKVPALLSKDNAKEGTLANTKVNTNVNTWPDHERVTALLVSEGASATPKARQVEKKLGALSRLSPQGRKMLVRSSVALGILTCLSIIVLVAILLWLDPARRQAARMQLVEANLEKELEAKPLDERTVRIHENQDGSILLTGYVETEKELVRLRGIAFESGLQIRVVSKEQLHAALKVIARQYGLFAKFRLRALEEDKISAEATQGAQMFHLRLEGFIEHERLLEEFRTTVRNALPYIVEIDTDVTTSEAMLTNMRTLLSHNAAFGGVELTLEEEYLLLQGAVFTNFHDELRSLLEHHYRSLPYRPLTKDLLTLVPPLQADITALLLGRQRAVDLRMRQGGDAKRYRIGESIDKNKTVIAITRNGILLSYLEHTVGLPIASLGEVPALEQKAMQDEQGASNDSANDEANNDETKNDETKNDETKNDEASNDKEETP